MSEAARRWGEHAVKAARDEFLQKLNGPARSGFQDFHVVNFAVNSLFAALMSENERLDETAPEALNTAFIAAQLTALTPMSEAIALSAKSAAGRKAGLDATVRRINALRTEWDAADRRLSLILSGGGTDSDAYRDLLARKGEIEAALDAERAQIAQIDPVYAATWDGYGVSVEALQAVLGPDEAYVNFVLLFEDIYVFATSSAAAPLVGVAAGAPCTGRYAGPEFDARMQADLDMREPIDRPSPRQHSPARIGTGRMC